MKKLSSLLANSTIADSNTFHISPIPPLHIPSDIPITYLTRFGGAGDDNIVGDAAGDMIWGNDGNDFILGLGGQDTLFGGNGDDWMNGGDDGDTLIGAAGDDRIGGDAGDPFAVLVQRPTDVGDFQSLRTALDPATLDALLRSDGSGDAGAQAAALQRAEGELRSLVEQLQRRATQLEQRAVTLRNQK